VVPGVVSGLRAPREVPRTTRTRGEVPRRARRASPSVTRRSRPPRPAGGPPDYAYQRGGSPPGAPRFTFRDQTIAASVPRGRSPGLRVPEGRFPAGRAALHLP
jgi:hypothetical protein